MSLSVIRPYFRVRMNSLGYREWKEPFTDGDNLPENILDGSYVVSPISVSGEQLDQKLQNLEAEITVTLFLKGFRDPSAAVDSGTAKGEGIIQEVMDPANRLGADLKNVIFSSMEVLPMADSNDNSIRVVLIFNNITQVCL